MFVISKLSNMTIVNSALFRYNPDVEIVGFHRIGEMKTLHFLNCECKALE